jgi:hypothetical protein
MLAKTVTADTKEIRAGLPEGAKLLAGLYADDANPKEDLDAARRGLSNSRQKVQDLRVAKSTFFALADPSGDVLRNDQEQDRMAGKNLFPGFPEIKKALASDYVETIGSMKEASGVGESRKDAQWIAAAPVRSPSGVAGLYVTGWSLSSYAFRLEFALRGQIRSDLGTEANQTENEPLVYVFVVVGPEVYGAPASPEVNREAVAKLDLIGKTQGEATYSSPLSITGRDFGVAAKRAPDLGKNVAIAVLRSET